MKYKILVIDDEVEITKVIKRFLTFKGFDVVTANRGEAGLEIFDAESVDLVFIDKKMPGMSGVDVFWEIKKRKPHIPVIIMTGSRRMEGYDNEKEKLGYAALLNKPADLDLILKSVKEVLKIEDGIEDKK